VFLGSVLYLPRSRDEHIFSLKLPSLELIKLGLLFLGWKRSSPDRDVDRPLLAVDCALCMQVLPAASTGARTVIMVMFPRKNNMQNESHETYAFVGIVPSISRCSANVSSRANIMFLNLKQDPDLKADEPWYSPARPVQTNNNVPVCTNMYQLPRTTIRLQTASYLVTARSLSCP
jgi:hypothetical protein